MGKKYRLSALKEAPVYHPTEDEFADPLRYIASIRAEAEEFGICRIVPPSSFKVPFNQDAASFAFKTRVQTVNELQLRLKKGKNRSFRTEYADFMQSRGQSVTRWPVYGGKKLDLQALYDNVTQRGGFDAVCRAKRYSGHFRRVEVSRPDHLSPKLFRIGRGRRFLQGAGSLVQPSGTLGCRIR